jgi:hypothetical protein
MRFKPTKPIGYAAAVILFLVVLEAGVALWQHNIPVSTAPVFSYPPAVANFGKSATLAPAIEMYRADRGAELTKDLPDGRKMTIFYFEWDKVKLGPFSIVGGHDTELCNVEYGSFKLLQKGKQRIHTAANGETLRFNYTLLAESNGKPVYVYRMPWIQGFGTWVNLGMNDRTTRVRRALFRQQGEARVLQGGISGVASEDEAWGLFQREVLDRLEWK